MVLSFVVKSSRRAGIAPTQASAERPAFIHTNGKGFTIKLHVTVHAAAVRLSFYRSQIGRVSVVGNAGAAAGVTFGGT